MDEADRKVIVMHHLLRQWSSHMAMPVLLVDADGLVLFFNESAEVLMGRRYDESEQMSVRTLVGAFEFTREDGTPVPGTRLPLGMAHIQRRPSHAQCRVRALDGVWRAVEITAFPLICQEGVYMGSVSVFWAADGETVLAPADELFDASTRGPDPDGLRQMALENILLQRWADYLMMPVFIVAPDGQFLHLNEVAASLGAVPSEETRDFSVDQFGSDFETTDLEGNPIPLEDLPIGVALSQRRPSHGQVRYRALDGQWWSTEATAFPLVGQGGRNLGAVAFYWEVETE